MQPSRRLAALAHRHLWQAIPRPLRRQALIGASSLLAPRIAADTDSLGGAPLIVAGFLTAASGLGASARLCYGALAGAGCRVLGIDLTRAFRQAASTVDFPFADGTGHRGGGTLLLHVNAPFVPLALWRLGAATVAQKRVIGCWHWELPVAPPEWRAGLAHVHRIVVPSRFVREAIVGLGGAVPVDVLPLPLLPPANAPGPAPAGRDGRPFTVLTVFNMASGLARKNPLAAIRAFGAAFPRAGEARLIVKMLNAESHAQGAESVRRLARETPNVELDERVLSAAELWGLYACADAVLSLHRSEGFGLVVAEGMRAGRPVLATDWSGNTDFLDAATGVPIPYRLVPAADPQGEYDHAETHWAEADVVAAAAQLMRLRAEPEAAARIGAAAATAARERFSPERYARRLSEICRLASQSPQA